jgi:hypothetical protein
MTNRVKQFWFPSLLTLLLSMGLLMLIERLGPKPWVIAPEHKMGWSLIAPAAVVYLPWLFLLPLIGAMGGIPLEARGWIAARHVLLHRFSGLALLGFFPFGITCDGPLQ